MCHLPAMRSSMAPSLPRRGPGFQLRMLRAVCSSKRLGTLLSKRYSALEGKCLLSWASRKIGLALSSLTKWRSRVETGSDIHQTVNPSRNDETSSSLQERNSSSECVKGSRLGVIPYWTGWITSGTTRCDGAGTSSGSITSGVPAGSALSCFSYLLNAHELLETLASGYGCQDDCGVEGRPGGTGGEPRHAFHPSSICLSAVGDAVGVHGLRKPSTVRIRFHFHC